MIEVKPIRFLKGVGAARAQLLEKLGIFSTRDLLEHYPVRYEDRSVITPIRSLNSGQLVAIYATIIAVQNRKIRPGLQLLNVTLSDGTGKLNLVYFNQQYLEQHFRIGDYVSAYGKVERNNFGISMANPEYEIFGSDECSSDYSQGIVPIYKMCEGISGKVLRKLINSVLSDSFELESTLPADIVNKHGLISYRMATRLIHQPQKLPDIDIARRRLVFEEFFAMQSCILLRRSRQKSRHTAIAMTNSGLADDLLHALPFELTMAQRKVWTEIRADLQRNCPMERLVQGDVGSGKTIISALAMAAAVSSGCQAAIMAPTEVLANQHYQSISGYFEKIGIRCELLTGKSKNRKKVLASIATGMTDVVIGTHALIQEAVAFLNLGLVITDEQHRFGVEQRAALRSKGNNPHMLVMTATPIPRTLALSIYGDLDISSVDELPPGRFPVKTYLRRNSKRDAVYEFARSQIHSGRQIFVVCPLVEDSEKLQAQSAKALFEELQQNQLRDEKSVLLHGQLKSSEKQQAMAAFSQREASVMVATTVIEVGIDVPNASLVIIEGAERFGLSQLHQLRGRVGRGKTQSYCILLTDSNNPDTLKRLEAFTSCNDGFAIADMDLQLRGAGHFFGLRQHGLSDLKIGDIVSDYKLMIECKLAVMKLLNTVEGMKFIQVFLANKYGDMPEMLTN